MIITTDHWLDTAERQPFAGGGDLRIRRLLVIHFTSGATGQSSIDGWREKADGILAHVVIERDGTIIQCRPFNRTCGHVGDRGKSRWRDPRNDHAMYDGLNKCAIGIELANAGADLGALRWARRQPGFSSIKARHRNGGPVLEWEVFPMVQLTACTRVAGLLCQQYNLDDITGHDCVAPERRDDPGPAFPMQNFREALGFRGLSVVFPK